MKITIDTERKVIEIDSTVKAEDFFEGLKSLLGKEWKEYSIEQKMPQWTYPIYPSYPTYPILYTNCPDSPTYELTSNIN